MDQNIKFTSPFGTGNPVIYHSYYNILLPLALWVEDYGFCLSDNEGDMCIMLCPAGANTLKLVIVTKYSEHIKEHHIQCYRNNELIFQWVDFISGYNLTRVIGDTLVIMQHGVVILNKVHPLP
jgi:hypothetical protein